MSALKDFYETMKEPVEVKQYEVVTYWRRWQDKTTNETRRELTKIEINIQNVEGIRNDEGELEYEDDWKLAYSYHIRKGENERQALVWLVQELYHLNDLGFVSTFGREIYEDEEGE